MGGREIRRAGPCATTAAARSSGTRASRPGLPASTPRCSRRCTAKTGAAGVRAGGHCRVPVCCACPSCSRAVGPGRRPCRCPYRSRLTIAQVLTAVPPLRTVDPDRTARRYRRQPLVDRRDPEHDRREGPPHLRLRLHVLRRDDRRGGLITDSPVTSPRRCSSAPDVAHPVDHGGLRPARRRRCAAARAMRPSAAASRSPSACARAAFSACSSTPERQRGVAGRVWSRSSRAATRGRWWRHGPRRPTASPSPSASPAAAPPGP